MTSASSLLLRSARNGLCALSLASASLLVGLAPAQARSADRLSYVFYADGSGSSTGSGDTDDWQRASALRAGNAPFLYVRQDGVAYVIRDAALLRQAAAIFAPQQALGARQGALGREQGELGRRQGALGAAQARASLSADAPRRQAELGRQQAALGSQQAALGARQAELGRQQAALAKASEKQIQALVADAMRRGLAQRVR